MGDTAVSPKVEAPTEPGFYRYSGGRQSMIFLLANGQWHAVFDNGDMNACHWEYVAQALTVWDLVKITSD